MIGGGTVTSCPFPVGFGGFFQIDPNTIYSGTKWEQKKDVFILAAGETYPAGSTGGEAQHTLTQTEIPNYKIGNIPEVVSSNHTNWNNGGVSGTDLGTVSTSKPGVFDNGGRLTLTNGVQYGYSVRTFGGGQAHNNMPPYYTMPFWIRTA